MRRALVMLVVSLAAAGCGADAASPTGSVPSASVSIVPPSVRISPTPTPSKRPTPAPSPTFAPSAFGWQSLVTIETRDPVGDWRLLAGSTIGYVASAGPPPGLWFSRDGVAWSHISLHAPQGTPLSVNTVTASDDLIVVGGSYTPCSREAYERDPFWECRPRPASWVSADGKSWNTSPRWGGPLGEPGRSGSVFNALWRIPTGGWDAAQAFDPSDESDGFDLAGPAIWHSSDGLAWKRLKAESPDFGECGILRASQLRAAADDHARRVASVGQESECESRVWTSADGRTWSAVDAFGKPSPIAVPRVVLPPASGRPWRILGWENGESFNSLGPVVWWSRDLVTWTKAPLSGGPSLSNTVLAATAAPGFDVAVSGDGATWTSEDGMTWRVADGRVARVESLASGPAGVIGLVGVMNPAGDETTGFEVLQLTSTATR